MVAGYFLKNAPFLTIQDLKDHDPSLTEITRDLRILIAVLQELAVADSYEDERMSINALQCCLTLERLARVVASGREEELDDIYRELEMHVTVPWKEIEMKDETKRLRLIKQAHKLIDRIEANLKHVVETIKADKNKAA